MAAPILLSTWRFGVRANLAGWGDALRVGGRLDALEKTCISCELDLAVDNVGVGGLPDSSGEVSLDGAVMLSPARCAGVAYLRRYAHPVSIARRVMEKTDHRLLVGAGAEAFAAGEGFALAELITADARARWEAWKASQAKVETHDTIGVLCLDGGGEIGAACSTSGRAWKLPGRVGDSPLIGHGLYCDPKVGAAVATGKGEMMMGVCASFLVVERMRMGDLPGEAVKYVLERIVSCYLGVTSAEQCGLIALRADGSFGSGALWEGFEVSVTSLEGGRVVRPDLVLMR